MAVKSANSVILEREFRRNVDIRDNSRIRLILELATRSRAAEWVAESDAVGAPCYTGRRPFGRAVRQRLGAGLVHVHLRVDDHRASVFVLVRTCFVRARESNPQPAD